MKSKIKESLFCNKNLKILLTYVHKTYSISVQYDEIRKTHL